MHLIAAGLGDTLGKYTCLLDWKLANMITGEYYCPEVVEMVRTALRTVRAQSEKVQTRDPEAVKAVTEALVLTGIAMSFVGNSRPASGCEHHCAHCWEMKALMEGRTPALHGTQVGVGTILALRLYHRLAHGAGGDRYSGRESPRGCRRRQGSPGPLHPPAAPLGSGTDGTVRCISGVKGTGTFIFSPGGVHAEQRDRLAGR